MVSKYQIAILFLLSSIISSCSVFKRHPKMVLMSPIGKDYNASKPFRLRVEAFFGDECHDSLKKYNFLIEGRTQWGKRIYVYTPKSFRDSVYPNQRIWILPLPKIEDTLISTCRSFETLVKVKRRYPTGYCYSIYADVWIRPE